MLPVHGQGGQLHRYTGVQALLASEYLEIEGSMERPWTRQNWVVHTFEFKRTSDREHGYVQRFDERATEQYASLLQNVREIVTSKGWKVQAVRNFIAGTKSMKQAGSVE